MDMNQLFHHHQMALIQKAAAKTDASRAANVKLLAHYRARIERYRTCRGLKPYFADGARTG